MTAPGSWLHGCTTDLKVALVFYTRLPFPHRGAIAGGDLARASWAAPVAGALVGALGAATYALAQAVGLGPMPAAGLALVATLAATGGLHEDGLADTVDAFGADTTRERRLEIMRDSRIGTYGACALAMSILLRWGALASLADPMRAAAALIATHAVARAALPLLMLITPPARIDGLSAGAGKPPRGSVALAALLGLAALGFGLGVISGLIALALVLIALGAVRRLAMAKIGGQTGDVLGALEQVSEVLILLTAARAPLL